MPSGLLCFNAIDMALIWIWGFSYKSLKVFRLRRNRIRLITDAKMAVAIAQKIGFLIRLYNKSIIEEAMDAVDVYLTIALLWTLGFFMVMQKSCCLWCNWFCMLLLKWLNSVQGLFLSGRIVSRQWLFWDSVNLYGNQDSSFLWQRLAIHSKQEEKNFYEIVNFLKPVTG